MKKIVGVIVVLVLIAVAGTILMKTDFNRMGKKAAYIEVIKPTEKEETKLDNGDVMTRYWYKQTAFNEKGEAIKVEFSAQKELRQGAYLLLYLKKGDEVTSYDEVKSDKIPEKVQKKLKEKYDK